MLVLICYCNNMEIEFTINGSHDEANLCCVSCTREVLFEMRC